jgi:hypothetical protein
MWWVGLDWNFLSAPASALLAHSSGKANGFIGRRAVANFDTLSV